MSPGDSPLDAPEAVIDLHRDDDPGGGDGGRGSFDVVVTVCAVVTTLLAAVVAFLHADASRMEERAMADAQRAAIAANRSTLRSRSAAHNELARLEKVAEHAAREGNARQRKVLLGAAAEDASSRWRSLRTQADDGLDPELGDQMAEAFFPWGFLDRRERKAAYLGARRDTLNDLSAQWGKRAATYMGLLTVLAVGLYLFGFSLSRPAEHMRGLFAAVGGLFLVVGVVFGPLQALFPPQAPSKQVARGYADGLVLLVTGDTPDDYAQAETRLRAAIDKWPRFARAYLLAAAAHQFASSPQHAQFMSLAPAESRRQTTSDYEKARELGLASVAGDLGFDLWALGLDRDRAELRRRALEHTRAAISRDPDDPVPVFNRAVALLASGRTHQGREAYREAIDVARDSHRFELFAASWKSGALTDLELVRRHAPVALAPQVQDMKELVVGSLEETPEGEPPSGASLSAVRVGVRPGLASVLPEGAQGFEGTPLYSVQWYQLWPGLGWAHLAEISGLGAPFSTSYVGTTAPPRCFSPGRYRAELYVGGRLVGEGDARNPTEGFRPVVERHLGVGACLPDDVRPIGGRLEPSKLPAASYVARYARDGRPDRGALTVFRLNDVTTSRRGAGVPEALLASVRHVAANRDLVLGRVGARNVPALQFLAESSTRAFRYEGGRLLASAGRDGDGSIVVAVTFGPERWFETRDPLMVHESVVPLYEYPDRTSP